MRFSVQKKLILIGSLISLMFFLVSYSISFFIFQDYSRNNFINSIDNSIAEVEHAIGDTDSLNQMREIVSLFYDRYLEHMNDEKNFENIDEEIDYYTSIYSEIYPSKSGLDMSLYKLKLKTDYLEISSQLANAAISAGGNAAYAGILIDPSISNDKGRFLYLFDSKFRFNDYSGEGHPFGSDYKLKDSDLDENPNKRYGGFIINGKKARVIDFDLGDVDGKDIVVTAFIEYDDINLKKEILIFGIVDGLSLFAAILLLTIAYILFVKFVIVKNITNLTNSTNKFTNSIIDGDAIELVNPNIKSYDEIGILSKSFIKMEEEIINYTEKIKKATAEKEKLNAELSVATTIQLESLPKNSLNDEHVLIRTFIKSAKEVGGDFYDYFYIDDNHLAIIISDVSGKGIPAALFMMKSKELIKSKLLSKKSLEEVCFEVNNELLENNDAGLFITALIGVLNVKTNKMELISAGHEKPFLLSKGKVERLNVKSNFILGGYKDYSYQKDVISLDVCDKLFLHTDGLNESINKDEVEFGYDNIKNSLLKNYNNRLNELLKNIDNELNSFVGDANQFDDITMLILEIKSTELRFSFNNPNYDIIDEITNRFNDYYSYINNNILAKTSIIIDEILNNYISYEKNDNLIINLSFDYIDNKLVLLFENNGIEFNPLLKEKKYIQNDNDLKPGGLGITMVKELSNEISYERSNGFNKLIVKINTN